MSEVKHEQTPQANDEALSEENLESVAGGIIDGGCIPDPFPTKPTYPDLTTY